MSSGNKLYRKQQCGWADKAEALLDDKGIDYEVHKFASKDEEEAFKEEHGVGTTPQVYIDHERIGGYTELADHFDEPVDENEGSSYQRVIAIFASTALMTWALSGTIMMFMGLSLSVLAILKLMDVSGFVEGFRKYDLVTQQVPTYGRIYPFLELIIGLGFLSLAYPTLIGLLALLVGAAGGISVIKAVYIDKTDLNCACVGGNSNVPLGAISFTENAMMVLMGLWLLL